MTGACRNGATRHLRNILRTSAEPQMNIRNPWRGEHDPPRDPRRRHRAERRSGDRAAAPTSARDSWLRATVRL